VLGALLGTGATRAAVVAGDASSGSKEEAGVARAAAEAALAVGLTQAAEAGGLGWRDRLRWQLLLRPQGERSTPQVGQ
jgi:hypothetical protein